MKLLIIIYCILGISATFMPWIYVPSVNRSMYGYIGDGLITGFLFFIALIVLLFQKNNSAFSNKAGITLIFIFACLSMISIYKIYDFNFSSNKYVEINFLISSAFAGTKLGIGVYVLALSSVASLMLTITQYSRSSVSFRNWFPLKKIGITVGAGIILWFAYLLLFENKNKHGSETALKLEFQEMYLAFQTNELEKYLLYIHPITVQPLGAENYINAIKGAREYMDMQNISVKSASIEDVLYTHKSINNIQSIAQSKIVFDTPKGDSISIQRTLCISENGGKNWYYFNTTGKSFQEIKKFFPYINDDLLHYINE